MNKNNQRVLGIIPARGGSKGIPKKNIYPINGKPLIAYSIEASIKSGVINNTVVTSDDEEILNIATKYGAKTIVRPLEFASDRASSESAITDCLLQLKKTGEEYDIFILLQPTSPLRDSNDIVQAYRLFIESNATTLISVYDPEHSPFKSFRINSNGFLEGLVDNRYPFMGRQELPKAYMSNGAIYIMYVDAYLKSGQLFSYKTIPYEMPFKRSIDVDTLNDILKIEKILNH